MSGGIDVCFCVTINWADIPNEIPVEEIDDEYQNSALAKIVNLEH